MKNVIQSSAESVLIQLELTEAAAAGKGIHKKY